jgi:predicted enzyme related to lactoylglutathione lyase
MYELTHFAINADDVQQARRFYRETFGWEFSAWGPPGFYRIEAGTPGGPGVTAALQQRRDLIPGRPVAGFESTVAVPDVAAVTAAALAAGGRVLMDKTTIEGVGDLVWLADPSDNVVGAMRYER